MSSRVYVLAPDGGAAACGCLERRCWRRVLRQTWCRWSTGHADIWLLEPGRMALLCSRCGRRTAGIALTGGGLTRTSSTTAARSPMTWRPR